MAAGSWALRVAARWTAWLRNARTPGDSNVSLTEPMWVWIQGPALSPSGGSRRSGHCFPRPASETTQPLPQALPAPVEMRHSLGGHPSVGLALRGDSGGTWWERLRRAPLNRPDLGWRKDQGVLCENSRSTCLYSARGTHVPASFRPPCGGARATLLPGIPTAASRP